jgi:hypothetical protein
MLQTRPLFAQNWQKMADFGPMNGDFLGIQFTDKYTGGVAQAIYYVSLALITTHQRAGF